MQSEATLLPALRTEGDVIGSVAHGFSDVLTVSRIGDSLQTEAALPSAPTDEGDVIGRLLVFLVLRF